MGKFVNATASDGHQLQVWMDGPEDATAGIVLVQEIFGVNNHIRNMCAKFAQQGYRVAAPALFDRIERGIELGYAGDDFQRALGLMKQLSFDTALLDVGAAAGLLPEGPRGIVGYCYGGSVAFLAAGRPGLVKAAVGWYGGAITRVRDTRLLCPVQLHFGAFDKAIPLSDVDLIREAQPQAEIYVYQNAEHGFGCDERATYNAEAAALAQARTDEFFRKHLV